MPKLENDKHERFCNEYIVDLNATAAYKRTYAGIKPETADANGSRLLGNARIQERISELQADVLKRTNVTATRTIQELANIAYGHLGLVCTQNSDGSLTLKELKNLKENEIGLLHSVKQSQFYNQEGELISIKHNFQMHDKMEALKLLMKHLGIADGIGAGKKDSSDADSRLLGSLTRVRERLKKRINKK